MSHPPLYRLTKGSTPPSTDPGSSLYHLGKWNKSGVKLHPFTLGTWASSQKLHEKFQKLTPSWWVWTYLENELKPSLLCTSIDLSLDAHPTAASRAKRKSHPPPIPSICKPKATYTRNLNSVKHATPPQLINRNLLSDQNEPRHNHHPTTRPPLSSKK